MKVKYVYLVLVMLFLFETKLSEAQNNQLQWANNLKVNKSNSGGEDIILDSKKNVIITGFFADSIDTDPGKGDAWLSSKGNNDAFLCKYDSNGQYIWSFQIGGISSDFGHQVSVDPSGNIYVCGNFNDSVDFDPGAGKFWMYSSGESMFVVKYNSAGKFVWAKQIGGTLQDWPGHTYVTNMICKKNIYISGYFDNTPDFDPGPDSVKLANPRIFEDGYVCALDTNGKFVLTKQLAGWGNALISSIRIAVDNSGNIYLGGNFVTDSIDFDPGASIYRLKPKGNYDIFLVKLDAVGNFIWVKQFGSTGNDDCTDIIVDASDNVYFSGGFNGTVDFDASAGTSNLISISATDGYVCKYNANGTFAMAKKTGGGFLGLDASNNIYIICNLVGTVDFDPDPGSAVFNITPTGTGDLVVCKLNSIGKFQWAVNTSGNNTTFFECVTATGVFVDLWGSCYATGNFNGVKDFDPGAGKYELNSNGFTEAFFMKLGICSLNAAATKSGAILTATPVGATYQWFDCSSKQAISGATNQTYTTTTSGSYGCWVTLGACKDTSNCVSVTITNGTLDFHKNPTQIFPNPTCGIVNVYIPENSTIVLHDIEGTALRTYSIEAGNHSLSLRDMKPGIYYITFTSDSWQITKSLVLNPE